MDKLILLQWRGHSHLLGGDIGGLRRGQLSGRGPGLVQRPQASTAAHDLNKNGA
jgi:hypothetical protein